MTREEFYKLTDILSTDILGNFMHGGEADELIAMFEEVVEHSNILEQEESVSEVLCAADSNSYKYIESVRGAAIQAFEDGAKWQKEQMMAKAVDGEVTYGKSLAIPSLGWVLDKEGLDYGDKVKLIIIKQE